MKSWPVVWVGLLAMAATALCADPASTPVGVAVLAEAHPSKPSPERDAVVRALREWGCRAETLALDAALDKSAGYPFVLAYALPTFTREQYARLDAYVRAGGILVIADNSCILIDKAPSDDIGFWDSIGALCRPVITRMPYRWNIVEVARGGKLYDVASVRFEEAGPLTAGLPIGGDISVKGLKMPSYKIVWLGHVFGKAAFADRQPGPLAMTAKAGRGASVSIMCGFADDPHIQRLHRNVFTRAAAEWLTREEERTSAAPPAAAAHPRFITPDDRARHDAELKTPELQAEWEKAYRHGVSVLSATGDITPAESKGRYFYSWDFFRHHDGQGKQWNDRARLAPYRNLNNARSLASLYAFTGEKRFGLAAKTFLLRTMREYEYLANLYYYHSGQNTALSAGAMGTSGGWVYDLVFDLMTPDERRFARQALMEKIIIPTYVDYVINDTYGPENTSNWIGVVCSGACTACLAIEPEARAEYPEFPRYFDAIKDKLRKYLDASIGVDGGCYEGVGYQNYGLGGPVAFIALQAQITGDSWHKRTRLNDVWSFALYTLFPDGRGHVGFNDSPVHGQYSAALLRELATAYDNGFVQWLHDREAERNTFYARDYRQTGVKPTSPDEGGLPTSIHFRTVGWAIHRTGWRDDDILLAFKSEPFVGTCHNHADENNFTLWAFGERLLIDGIGFKGYDDPNHPRYKATESHNVILVDGQGQRRKQSIDLGTGKIVSCLGSDSYGQVAGEAAETYGDAVKSFARNLLFVKPDYIVLFDDIRSAKGPVQIDWLLHAVGGPETFQVAGDTITIRRPKAELAVKMLAPQSFTHEVQEFGTTPFWQDGKWGETKRSRIALRPASPAERVRFLAVLAPVHPGETAPEVEDLSGRQADVWGAKVVTDAGADTILFAPTGKMQPLDGVQTDGTKCMARRADGVTRFAAHEATFLDVDGVRLFTCDARISLAALRAAGHTDVVVEAPGDVHLSMNVPAPPSGVSLDGAPLDRNRWRHDGETGRLTIDAPKGTHSLSIAGEAG